MRKYEAEENMIHRRTPQPAGGTKGMRNRVATLGRRFFLVLLQTMVAESAHIENMVGSYC